MSEIRSPDPPFPLSRPLQTLREQLEQKLGKTVVFIHDPQLDGRMASNSRQEIFYRSPEEYSEARVAEELLHIDLLADGHPTAAGGNESLCTMLEGLSHHQIIFPILKAMGFHVENKECAGIARQLDQLEELDTESLARDSLATAVVALLSARCQLECGSADLRARCENLFSAPPLREARRLGREVAETVSRCNLPPQERGPMLEDCVRILRVEDLITIS